MRDILYGSLCVTAENGTQTRTDGGINGGLAMTVESGTQTRTDGGINGDLAMTAESVTEVMTDDNVPEENKKQLASKVSTNRALLSKDNIIHIAAREKIRNTWNKNCNDPDGISFQAGVRTLLDKPDAVKHLPDLEEAMKKNALLGCKVKVYRIIFDKLMLLVRGEGGYRKDNLEYRKDLINLLRHMYNWDSNTPFGFWTHKAVIEWLANPENFNIPHLFTTEKEYPGKILGEVIDGKLTLEKAIQDASVVDLIELWTHQQTFHENGQSIQRVIEILDPQFVGLGASSATRKHYTPT